MGNMGTPGALMRHGSGNEVATPDLSRTMRVSIASLWRVLNEPRGVRVEEPPPALPSCGEPEGDFKEGVRRRFEWALEGPGARVGREPIESSLGELFAVEPDVDRCVRALHHTGLIDERRAGFYADRLNGARKDGIMKRVLLGRLANDVRWRFTSTTAQ